MTVVKWVSDLEGVNSISILGLYLFLNLSWGQSVFVQPIIKHDSLGESGCSTDKEVSLLNDSLSLWVIARPRTECPRAYFFLSIFEENRIADDCKYIITKSRTFNGNSIFIL